MKRFAETGAGSVKKLQGVDPPEYRFRVGDYRDRFETDGNSVLISRVRRRNRREAYH